MTLALVKTTAAPERKVKVLNERFNERLTALTTAERILRNELDMTVVFTKLAGQWPQIAIQYQPGQMTRVLNRMTERSNVDDGDCYIVSGRFEGVTLMWAVDK